MVHAFARSLLETDPAAKLIVLGDLNDVPGSAPVAALAGGLLVNLLETLPEPERYSYVFNGQSEAIDQILVSPGLLAASPVVDVVHGHAEIAGAPSDHDPVWRASPCHRARMADEVSPSVPPELSPSADWGGVRWSRLPRFRLADMCSKNATLSVGCRRLAQDLPY